jgi:hypothetical protein
MANEHNRGVYAGSLFIRHCSTRLATKCQQSVIELCSKEHFCSCHLAMVEWLVSWLT